jgi:hypothetical protein
MRIRVVRSGGFAALRVERAVETERLPEAERVEVEHLVVEARFFDLPEPAPSRLPDVIQYRVRVETRERSREITTDERTASATLFALVERVLAIDD